MEIRKLNTLRALAAVIVFITHFSDETNWLDGVLGGGSGAYGVMLFFLLSGFLMSYLYLEKDFNRANVAHYFLARAGRVLPLYIVVVAASYGLSVAGNETLYNIPDVSALIGHLLFLYGDSVLWSIPPEIQFYFIFIIFWAWAKKRRGYIYLACFAVMILLFFTNFPRIQGEMNGIPYNEFNVLRSLPFFFVGGLFGMNYRSLNVPEYLKKHWFVLVLCLIPLMYPDLTNVTSDAARRMWLSYEVLMVMSFTFFCVVFLVPNDNVLLANRLGDFMGKISYSLYLLHLPIIVQVTKLDLSIELKLALSFAISVLLAYISFRFFEKPIANRIRSMLSKNQTCLKSEKNELPTGSSV